MTRTLATMLLGLALSGGVAGGQEPAEVAQPGEGVPLCGPAVAWYARPFVPGHYTGYYVGGGCVFKGSPADPTQGTWGWDYQGYGYFPRNVWLKWCCRYQGGVGAYKTDGPPVPNVLAFPPHKHGAKEESEHEAKGNHEKQGTAGRQPPG